MRCILIFLLACCTLLSCKSKEQELVIPSEIIQKEQMIEILEDVYLAHGIVDIQKSLPLKEKMKEKKAYMLGIYEKYDIEESYFITSFDYYSAHPELFTEINDSVIVNLTKLEAEQSKP